MGVFGSFSGGSRAGFIFNNPHSSAFVNPGTNPLTHPSVIPQFNADIRKWGNTTNYILRNVVNSTLTKGKKSSPHIYKKGIHKGKSERHLGESLKSTFKSEDGGMKIEVVKFGMERHGVFVQKGVGRGYKISGKVLGPNTRNKTVGSRSPKDWYNKTIDANSLKLSNLLVKHHANAVILNTKHIFII